MRAFSSSRVNHVCLMDVYLDYLLFCLTLYFIYFQESYIIIFFIKKEGGQKKVYIIVSLECFNSMPTDPQET